MDMVNMHCRNVRHSPRINKNINKKIKDIAPGLESTAYAMEHLFTMIDG